MLLIIDNYDSFTYNLYQSLSLFYQPILIVRNDKITINEIIQLNLNGIILSPGPGKPENAGICLSLIKTLLRQSVKPIPLLGICLGHQALALACGGKVVAADKIVHGKQDYIYHQQTELYQEISQPFLAGRYHSLIVANEGLPNNIIIESHTSQNLIMGIKHHYLPLYGMQFHPESILTPEGDKILQQFVQICLRRKSKKGNQPCN